jgi:hypothetical protein
MLILHEQFDARAIVATILSCVSRLHGTQSRKTKRTVLTTERAAATLGWLAALRTVAAGTEECT